jgi:predicted glycoside hydrolase/deacetylase ChbG (UPF0249 family)
VNADDFGFSDHTVEATIECFKKRVISSATMMPNMPGFEKACEFAVNHPEFSYGLHLCLTDERPLSKPDQIPSLVDTSGLLWPTREFWKRAVLGRLSRDEIVKEMEAQISRIRDTGISLSHIDGHGYVHTAPIVLSVLPRILRKHAISAMRRTQNLFYGKSHMTRRFYNIIFNMFTNNIANTTDYFLMIIGKLEKDDSRWWSQSIRRLPAGITEIGIHPGLDEEWRRFESLPVLEDRGSSLRNEGVKLVNYNHLSTHFQP